MADLVQDLELALMDGFNQAMKDAYRQARLKSAGTYSLADLADMDHPYAKRHGTPLLDPSTINIQSGRFISSWKQMPITSSGGAIVGIIVNESVEADYLKDGTRYMFKRPIDVEVEAYLAQAIDDRVNQKIKVWERTLYRY
jgi:hypothetical protein